MASDLHTEFRVEATITAVTKLDHCNDCAAETEASLSIELEEPGGSRRWRLVASPFASVEEWKALGDALLGEEVRLMYRYRRLFQSELSTGFILEDQRGVVLAAEIGPRVQTLNAADLSGFRVMPGPDVCVTESFCDRWLYHELLFSGDTTAAVGLSEVGTFAIGGHMYGARNSGAGTYVGSCPDTEIASPWSIWRRAQR